MRTSREVVAPTWSAGREDLTTNTHDEMIAAERADIERLWMTKEFDLVVMTHAAAVDRMWWSMMNAAENSHQRLMTVTVTMTPTLVWYVDSYINTCRYWTHFSTFLVTAVECLFSLITNGISLSVLHNTTTAVVEITDCCVTM